MSFDLMVFDPTVAPRDKEQFLAWYETSMDEADEGEYDDPTTTTDALRGWYEAMNATWPDMNAPTSFSVFEEAGDRVTGYMFGAAIIYCDFRWSVAEEAYNSAKKLAMEHKVGFFNASGDDAETVFPVST